MAVFLVPARCPICNSPSPVCLRTLTYGCFLIHLLLVQYLADAMAEDEEGTEMTAVIPEIESHVWRVRPALLEVARILEGNYIVFGGMEYIGGCLRWRNTYRIRTDGQRVHRNMHQAGAKQSLV